MIEIASDCKRFTHDELVKELKQLVNKINDVMGFDRHELFEVIAILSYVLAEYCEGDFLELSYC